MAPFCHSVLALTHALHRSFWGSGVRKELRIKGACLIDAMFLAGTMLFSVPGCNIGTLKKGLRADPENIEVAHRVSGRWYF